MWELDCAEIWAPKHWCFWTVVLEKTLESPLDCKEIQPVHPTEDKSWVFIGRTDAEAETPILWPPHVKSWLTGKDPDAGRDWGQEEKGTTEDEVAGWHHWLDGHEFEWTPGVGDGQGGLVCCVSWSRKESDMIERLNWTELNIIKYSLSKYKYKIVWYTDVNPVDTQKLMMECILPFCIFSYISNSLCPVVAELFFILLSKWKKKIENMGLLCNDLDGWSEGRWEGGPRGRGYMHTYSWFTLLYSRNTILQSS